MESGTGVRCAEGLLKIKCEFLFLTSLIGNRKKNGIYFFTTIYQTTVRLNIMPVIARQKYDSEHDSSSNTLLTSRPTEKYSITVTS